MNDFAIYKMATGEVDRIFGGDAATLPLNLYAGEAGVLLPPGLNEMNMFVLDGQATEKQPLNVPGFIQIVADGIDEALITGIPAGVMIQWPDGQTDEVTSGEVRFSVDLPGTYKLKFSAIPYLDKEVTIEAVSAT